MPRTKEDIALNLTCFKVAIEDGQLVGCGSLHIYDSRLVEIRSLGVDNSYHGRGIGKALVQALVVVARCMNLSVIFSLTRNVSFFSALGFEKASMDVLPEKVMKDCHYCTKQEQCDEVAMIYQVP